MENFAPPTILAQASRLNFSTRLFNLIVTNVPGPQFPLYLLGRELQDVFPVAFLPNDHALAIAIMSYNGEMNFGLLGDYDALPDLDEFADGVRRALADLVARAREQQRRAAAVRAGRARPPSPATSRRAAGQRVGAAAERPARAGGVARGAPRAARALPRRLVAERELRVLGHLVRGPRRREDHRRGDLVDALELAHELVDLLGDLRADRAGGRRQGVGDVDLRPVELDAVDQAQLDEVEPQLGVDDVRQRVLDRLRRRACLESSPGP